MSQLESSKKDAEALITHLKAQNDAYWHEINDLRARLNIAPLPPPSEDNGTLGLVVSGSGGDT